MCNENVRNKEKQHAHKNVIDGRKHFIECLQKTGENDWDKLWVNNSGQNKGSICLVNGCQGDGIQVWAHEWVLLNSQWVVLRISGADFLHCWVTDSILFGTC